MWLRNKVEEEREQGVGEGSSIQPWSRLAARGAAVNKVDTGCLRSREYGEQKRRVLTWKLEVQIVNQKEGERTETPSLRE